MTARFSTGLRNYVADKGSYRDALAGGMLEIYTGSQPTTADAAPTGTLLTTITDASGAHTNEILAQGTVTLTGGGSGSLNTITVDGIDILGGAVAFDTSLAVTAAAAAVAINANQSEPRYTAAVLSGAIITITAARGTGTEANGLVVASTGTTITTTNVNMGTTTAGVDSVNGLRFGVASGGILNKLSSQTWSGVTGVTGTAGWFRFTGSVADSGLLDSAGTEIRLDGAVSTSGQQLNMSSTSFVATATETISAMPITLPAA